LLKRQRWRSDSVDADRPAGMPGAPRKARASPIAGKRPSVKKRRFLVDAAGLSVVYAAHRMGV
jgi:hypothetical protein